MSEWVQIGEDDRPYLVFDVDGVSVNTSTTNSLVISGLRYVYVPDRSKLQLANKGQ